MLADRSAMNLDLTSRSVQEGYNHSMSAGQSAVIILFLASRYWVGTITVSRLVCHGLASHWPVNSQ